MIYLLKLGAQNLPVRNNAPPHIRKPPHNRRLSPTLLCVVYLFFVSNPTQIMEIRVKNNEANYLLVRQ
jgi:hypothetical protein